MVNLLVYSGPEVLPAALRTTLSHLARILLPNYTIQPINVPVLLNQPWTTNCQVLIFPALKTSTGSAGIVAGIPPRLNGVINDFLEGGGNILCLNAAGRITRGLRGRGLGGIGGMGAAGQHLNGSSGSNASNSESEDFAFVDRTTGLTISPISLLESSQKKDPSTRRIRGEGGPSGGEPVEGIVEGNMPQFEFESSGGAGLTNKMEILAESMEQDGSHIAALRCQIGSGFVTFWAPNLENLSEEGSSAPTNLSSSSSSSQLILLRYVLSRIGLKPPHPTAGHVSRPLPQLLLSTPDKPGLVEAVVRGLLGSVPGVGSVKFQDTNDTFEFHGYDEGLAILRQMRKQGHIESADDGQPHKPSNISHIAICPNGTVPSVEDTPLFDLRTYFNLLKEARTREECRRDVSGFGETLIYGQVIGSTQTLFDK